MKSVRLTDFYENLPSGDLESSNIREIHDTLTSIHRFAWTYSVFLFSLMYSVAAKRVPKIRKSCRLKRKRLKNSGGAFAWSETFPKSLGKLSLEAKPSLKIWGSHRLKRNPLENSREVVAWSETFSKNPEKPSLEAKPCQKVFYSKQKLRMLLQLFYNPFDMIFSNK